MDTYEYMLVYIILGKDVKIEIKSAGDGKDEDESKVVIWENRKDYNIRSSFRDICVVSKTYDSPKENHLEGKSTVLLTKQRAYYKDHKYEGVHSPGYFFSNPEQPFIVLAEVFAKYGADGWHVIETKSGEGKMPFGVAILERRIIEPMA
jgi:hypothetical protein